jgi:hypothetical protein
MDFFVVSDAVAAVAVEAVAVEAVAVASVLFLTIIVQPPNKSFEKLDFKNGLKHWLTQTR